MQEPIRFSTKRSEQYADNSPRHEPISDVPVGWSVTWNEQQGQIGDARLWPQARLMQPMIGQLARLPNLATVLASGSIAARFGYYPPAAATSGDACAEAAATIHRLFRYLEAENHWLDIRLPKSAERRRNFLEITVQPRLKSKPVAQQLKELESAAATGDALAWEATWRGLTMPALRVLDQALGEAMADKRHPLKLRVDFWGTGRILSSPIPTPEYVTAVLPIARRIAAKSGHPGRQAKDATVKSLSAVFRTLTGRDAEVIRGGHRHVGQSRELRARGSAVVFVLWLMCCFRSLLVKSGAYSTWRSAVYGRETTGKATAGRQSDGIVGTACSDPAVRPAKTSVSRGPRRRPK